MIHLLDRPRHPVEGDAVFSQVGLGGLDCLVGRRPLVGGRLGAEEQDREDVSEQTADEDMF